MNKKERDERKLKKKEKNTKKEQNKNKNGLNFNKKDVISMTKGKKRQEKEQKLKRMAKENGDFLSVSEMQDKAESMGYPVRINVTMKS